MQDKNDMGLALLEVQNWQKITVDDDCAIVSEDNWDGEALNFSLKSNFMETLEPNSESLLQSMLSRAIAEHVCSNILLTLDGTPLEVLLMRRDKNLDIFVRNIEDRLGSLEHYSIYYRHFLTTPTAICFTDNEANIIDANKSFLDLYGYRLDEVAGQNPRILKSSRQSPLVYREMWKSITNSSSGSWSGEIFNRCKDGEEKTVHLTISRVLRSNGSLIGYVGSTIDISREKRLAESLRSQNDEFIALDSLKTGLMAYTSSDLKTHLNAIISRASLIKETIDVASRGKLLEQAGWIISECSRMNTLVTDYFEAGTNESRQSGLRTTRVRLNSVLRTCIDINTAIADKKEIQITLEILATPEPVLIEVLKMERVFNTLIANAVKSSPFGSVVSVRYQDCPEGKLIEILDQGPKLPEEDLEVVFDRYFRVKKSGALTQRVLGIGLSLNISKNIVESHGGKIKAGNLKSGGCIFSVTIPTGRVIESGRDLAAVIHDPSENAFQSIERPLKANKVSCFITKSVSEVRRVFEYEKPDLAFISRESLTPELMSLCLETKELDDSRTEFILIDHGESAFPDTFFSRVLITPVQDVDVLRIIKDHQAKPLAEAGETGETGVYSIIIIDDDETTHDVLGEYLSGAGYDIKHAYHPAEVLKLQSILRCDLILLDEQMQEVDGFKIVDSIKGNSLLRDVPIIKLSQTRHEDDIGYLEAGGNFIIKPFIKAEVLDCVKTALHKNVRTSKIEKVLEGNLATISLPTLLQTLEIGQKSLLVRLVDIDGEIHIVNGMFVSARYGAFCGEEAFNRIFFLEKGEFSVLISNYHPEPSDTSVPVESLLMKSVVYLDEVRFLLAGVPLDGRPLDLAEGTELSGKFENIFFPCLLEELLVQMKGDLKSNAELIVEAYKKGILKPLRV